METDALESTRKFLEERVSLRYRREDEKPAGSKNVSSDPPVSFPTRSRVAYTSGPCLCVSCGTSRWRRQGMGTSDGGERQLGCWNSRRWWNRMKMSCCFGGVQVWLDRGQKLGVQNLVPYILLQTLAIVLKHIVVNLRARVNGSDLQSSSKPSKFNKQFQQGGAGKRATQKSSQQKITAQNQVVAKLFTQMSLQQHLFVFLKFPSFLIASNSLKIKYFHCFWILWCLKIIQFYSLESFQFFTSTEC